MSSEMAIQILGLSKCYEIYDKPQDRLKQMFARGGKRHYREFWALRDVEFSIRKGETVGIIGKNGSGKSTLLQIICGTLNPTAGRVQVNGRVAALLELGSGFNPEFTGRENVYMNGAVLGLTREEIDERFDTIAAFAEIGDFMDQPARTYSSGMYVRLAFAVAINVDPDILIVDEALSVGDIRFQLKCQRAFQAFKDQGKTLLLVSHSSTDIVRLCQQAIWLDGGVKREEGPAKAVVERYHAEMVHDVRSPAPTPVSDSQLLTVDSQALWPLPGNVTITGEGGVQVLGVALLDSDGNKVSVVRHPGPMRISYLVETKVRVEIPFFAFQLINSKGLRVTGSNTWVQAIEYEPIDAGARVLVHFDFNLPELENGEYLIAIGAGDGSAYQHIRHAYVADAFNFQISSNSVYQTQAVLLKLPDCKTEIEIG